MNFEHAWALYLLPLVPVIGGGWLLLSWRRQRRFKSIFDPELQRRFAKPIPWKRSLVQISCLLIALGLAVIALAKPRGRMAHEVTAPPGHDLVIAMDVSRSMLARDVTPNRLERARYILQDFVASVDRHRIALIAFSGGARRIVPLTDDTDYISQSLQGMGIDSAPRGPTDVGSALHKALDSFIDDTPTTRTVILVSDGEDLAGNIDQALQYARRRGIAFLTIGIGTETGAPIPDDLSPTGYQKHEGRRVITRLKHETLETIATQTDGIHIPLADGILDLESIYQAFRPTTLKDSGGAGNANQRYDELFQWFLAPAIALLLLAASLSHGRPAAKRSASRRALTAALVFLNAMAPEHAPANAGTEAADLPARPARKAMRLYHNGKHLAAAATFETAAARESQPEIKAKLMYNAARARFKGGEFQKAALLLADALDTHTRPDPVWRHDLALTRIEAAIVALETPNDSDRLANIHQDLLNSATDLWKIIRRHPEMKAWQITLERLNGTLQKLDREIHRLEMIDQYGHMQTSGLADIVQERQHSVTSRLTEAARVPLPEQIRRFKKIADEQRQIAGIINLLAVALQEDQDNLRRIEGLKSAMHAAADQIDDAGKYAVTALREIEAAVYELWKNLADPQALLRETIKRQNAAIADVETALSTPDGMIAETGAAQQREAYELNLRLRERIRRIRDLKVPNHVIPDDPNEYRARLIDRTTAAAGKQEDAIDYLSRHRMPEARQAQKQAAAILQDLRELLEPRPSPANDQDGEERHPEDKNEIDPPDKPDKPTEQPPDLPLAGGDIGEEIATERDPDTGLHPEDIQEALERIRRHERDYLEERRRRTPRPPPGQKDW